MKKLYIAIFALLAAATITTVACAKGRSAGPPTSMPREKALVILSANLQQQDLATQVSVLQEKIQEREAKMKEILEERASYLREFDIKPGDEIDFKTGAIKRAPPKAEEKQAKSAAVIAPTAVPASAITSPPVNQSTPDKKPSAPHGARDVKQAKEQLAQIKKELSDSCYDMRFYNRKFCGAEECDKPLPPECRELSRR